MSLGSVRPQLELMGRRSSGQLRGAVLVLEGARKDDLRRASALAAYLTEKCFLVAVDGGLKTCRAARRRPDLFVGDADSAGRVPSGMNAVVFPVSKDFSDLAGALREVRRRRAGVVFVAGLLGGRLDHEWANLQELAANAPHFAALIAPTARGTVIVTSHGCRAVTVRGRHVSLFPLGGTAVVSLTGTRYALQRRRLRHGSVGLSNVAGTRLTLRVHRGVVALVFPAAR